MLQREHKFAVNAVEAKGFSIVDFCWKTLLTESAFRSYAVFNKSANDI
jgi:hypothetical protein